MAPSIGCFPNEHSATRIHPVISQRTGSISSIIWPVTGLKENSCVIKSLDRTQEGP